MKTDNIINLTTSQSKQLAETGECVFIEPMDPQPDRIVDEGWWQRPLFNNLPMDFKYQIDQLLTIRSPWQKDFDPLNDDMGILQPPETMPSHLHQTLTIKDLEIKQVQEIDSATFDKIAFYGIKPDLYPGPGDIKDYFNKQFAEPKPVTCKDVCENGIKYGYHKDDKVYCSTCNGDGIESYISYVYDNDYMGILSEISDRVENKSAFFDSPNDKDNFWLNKPLQIILNPFTYILGIGK